MGEATVAGVGEAGVAEGTRGGRDAWVAVVGLVVVYGVFLGARFAPAIVMPDDNGYFAQASLMVRTGSTWFVPESDA